MSKRRVPPGFWAVVLAIPTGNAILTLSPKIGVAASLGEMLAVVICFHATFCGITLLLHWGGCRQSPALWRRRSGLTESQSTGKHPAR